MARRMVTGVVGVLDRGGRYLVIRRAAGIPAGGLWCFPGGAVRDAESLADAIQREMREEVGLTVRPQREVWRWQNEGRRVDLHWWVVREDREGPLVLAEAEVADAVWLTPDEIARLDPLIEGNREFLTGVASGAISLAG